MRENEVNFRLIADLEIPHDGKDPSDQCRLIGFALAKSVNDLFLRCPALPAATQRISWLGRNRSGAFVGDLRIPVALQIRCPAR